MVTPNGSLKTGYTYDELGNIDQIGSQTFLNDVTFTGSVTDKSTGLQYMNSRFYNPSTGRFLSQDTYTGNPYEPWTQHLYSYCGNNPTSMVDPTGHFFGGLFGIGAALSNGNSGGIWGSIVGAVTTLAVIAVGTALTVATGGLAAVAVGALIGAAAGVAGSLAGQVTEDLVNGEKIGIDGGKVLRAGIFGAIGGAIGGGLTSMLNLGSTASTTAARMFVAGATIDPIIGIGNTVADMAYDGNLNTSNSSPVPSPAPVDEAKIAAMNEHGKKYMAYKTKKQVTKAKVNSLNAYGQWYTQKQDAKQQVTQARVNSLNAYGQWYMQQKAT